MSSSRHALSSPMLKARPPIPAPTTAIRLPALQRCSSGLGYRKQPRKQDRLVPLPNSTDA